MRCCKKNTKHSSILHKKILIIEENAIAKSALTIKLSNCGFFTLSLQNTQNCLEVVKNKKPDLVLLSLCKEDNEEIKKIELCKNNPETNKTPVVVLINECRESFKTKIKKIGVKEIYTKTEISLEKLVEKINKII